jgi:hypothetical protein
MGSLVDSVTTEQGVCECCGATLPAPKRQNRPRRFCGSACRSKAYWDREEMDMRQALANLKKIRGSFDQLEQALACRTSRKTIKN